MIIPVERQKLWYPGKPVHFNFSNAALLIPGCGCCLNTGTGWFPSGARLYRYIDGVMQWYYPSGEVASGLYWAAVDDDDNCYVLAGKDAIIEKIDPDGARVWTSGDIPLGGNNLARRGSTLLDRSYLYSTSNWPASDSYTLWRTKTLDGSIEGVYLHYSTLSSCAVTPGGNVVAGGYDWRPYTEPEFPENLFEIPPGGCDPGDWNWGVDTGSTVSCVVTDSDGNVYTLRSGTVHPDYWEIIDKYNSEGVLQWSITIEDFYPSMIDCDDDGDVYFVAARYDSKSVWKADSTGIIDSYDTGGETEDVFVRGDYLFVSGARTSNKNVWVLNRSDMALVNSIDVGQASKIYIMAIAPSHP